MTITYPLLVNALIAGLLMGGFYAALSVGATVAFGLLDIVNIAHPTFAVIGAYAVLVLNRAFNIDPIICGLLLTPVFYGAGMLLYQVYHYFFERRGDDAMRGLAFSSA
jgi:branched-chain amino acid transport system permease protein